MLPSQLHPDMTASSAGFVSTPDHTGIAPKTRPLLTAEIYTTPSSLSEARPIGLPSKAYIKVVLHALQLGDMLSEFGIPPLAAILTVIVSGLALFDPIGQRLGGHGASGNPATNACFAALGKGTAFQHVVRAVGTAPCHFSTANTPIVHAPQVRQDGVKVKTQW